MPSRILIHPPEPEPPRLVDRPPFGHRSARSCSLVGRPASTASFAVTSTAKNTSTRCGSCPPRATAADSDPRQFGGARVVLRSLAGSGCSPKTYALNPGAARGAARGAQTGKTRQRVNRPSESPQSPEQSSPRLAARETRPLSKSLSRSDSESAQIPICAGVRRCRHSARAPDSHGQRRCRRPRLV